MISLPLSILLALIASWFILIPIVEGVKETELLSADQELLREKERLFLALEELEQDRVLNRITEQSYLINKQEAFAKLTVCLENLKRK